MTAKHVYVAINEVTAIMAGEGISKGRKNEQQGYRFRGIDDVYGAISRHLATAKLCILPRVVERTAVDRTTKNGGVATYTVLTVEFDLVSSVDGSTHTIRTMGEAMDTADKSTNKAMSAAMKYACLLAFQIPTEGDNDADATHIERVPPTYEKQLAASIEWVEWEKTQAAALRASKTIGQLQETWAASVEANSPNGIIKRLATVKDGRKAELRTAGAAAQ